MSGKSSAGKGEGRVLSQADCLRIHNQRHASAGAPAEKETSGYAPAHASAIFAHPTPQFILNVDMTAFSLYVGQ